MNLFFEIHHDLPREGPGDDISTTRALALMSGLPDHPVVLDIGCGPGMQTRELARRTDGHITAVDTHPPFLDMLKHSARREGLAGNIHLLRASMFELPFMDGSFDALWSEGAIYIMGFEAGLRAWKRLLKPGGCLAVTEISWLKPDPPAEIYRYWMNEYPAIRSVEHDLELVSMAGYHLLGHFTLPAESWWTDYYTPMLARIEMLRQKYTADLTVVKYRDARSCVSILEEALLETEMHRKYAGWYGYEFYVMQAL